MLFAWTVGKYVKSNAIVFCAGGMTLGVGAGQMSRIDSARIASIKAQNAGLALAGSVVASDAFFPFRDGLDVVVDAGATCVIQPGGSMRDQEVIDAADEQGQGDRDVEVGGAEFDGGPGAGEERRARPRQRDHAQQEAEPAEERAVLRCARVGPRLRAEAVENAVKLVLQHISVDEYDRDFPTRPGVTVLALAIREINLDPGMVRQGRSLEEMEARREVRMSPNSERCTCWMAPWPWHVPHRMGCEPSAAPLPSHVSHVTAVSTLSSRVVPKAASARSASSPRSVGS